MVHAKTDVAIIGGGPGGLTTALSLRRRNPKLKITLIEKAELGGSNLYSGTMPIKSLLHLARSRYLTDSHQTADTLLRNNRDRVAAFSIDYDEIEFQKKDIDILKGEPEFVGRRSLIINDTKLRFKYAVIATGSVARSMQVKGLSAEYVLRSSQLFQQKKMPKKLVIVGAGRTGVEFAQAAAMLGSSVTIVNEHEKLMPHLNKEIRILLEDGLRANKITILHQARIHKVHDYVAEIQHSLGVSKVNFDKVLCAVGREPALPHGLKRAHVRVKPEGIPTNLKHQTRNHRIFAIGDVASKSHFAHIAVDQGYDVAEFICNWRSRFHQRPLPLIPATLHTSPQVATVGLSYLDARKAHRRRSLKKIVVPYWHNDRARAEGTQDGMLTIVVKKRTSQIIGVQIAGESAPELIGMFCVAMQNNMTLLQLGATLLPYPTYNELISVAAERFYTEDE